ncbi:MFS transporter [Streptomyces cavernicola]|uniref:MFS transporter n=1 Tax=Streptomyces cavernicola TaxID=3043613 RepID=A0ABT6S310_9ACTN|nr:MFS transporter [Streptomyces sp. B-S-A6]MDI3402433.1 MFS transporter [Streptomyces sp. B-S-A6]
MEAPPVNRAQDASPRHRQLEDTLDRIGVTGAHKQIGAMVLLGVFFDALEQNAVGLVGPVLQESWGTTAAELGFLNTITFTAAALGRLTTGIIGDKTGRRAMLTVNLLLFSLGALICAFAPNYAVVALGRFIVGFGLGGEIAIAVTMMSEFFAARHRGTAVGIINVTAGGLGNMLAPGFGVLVFTFVSGPDRWRWLFGLLAVPALLVLFYRRYVPETPRYLLSRGKVGEANQVLNRLASGRLRGRLDKPEQYIDAVESGEQVMPERNRLRDVFAGALRRRTLSLGVAVCMSYGAQISILSLMPTILVAQGHSITKSLVFTLVMQSGSLLGALIASTAARYVPRKLVLTITAGLACAAAFAFGFLATNVALILILGALVNCCIITLNTTIWIFAPEQFPTRVRAFGTSIILALGSLAGGLTPIFAGAAFDAYGIAGMFTLLGVLFVGLAVSVQFPPETFGKSMEESGEEPGEKAWETPADAETPTDTESSK